MKGASFGHCKEKEECWIDWDRGKGCIRTLGKVQVSFQKLSFPFLRACASHFWDAGGSRFGP